MSGKQKPRSRTGSAPFRAHARLMRLLGEELISDEVIAIVELVKNSYDADAHHVQVTLEGVTLPEGGLIRVLDNGNGMSLNTVLRNWLEPATSPKRPRNGKKTRTPLGRIPLGEKGIGRFAVDKLGSELELVTRAPGEPEETVLSVKWHHYDQDTYLDQVENYWQTREPEEFPGDLYGTAVKIRKQRSIWDQTMVMRLHEGLMRLISPFAANTDFAIDLQCPEFPDYSGEVANSLLETAPYQLAGIIAEGVLTCSNPKVNAVDLRVLSRDRFACEDGSLRAPHCGPFSINLNVWDLEPATGSTPGVSNSLRKTIKARSGISIYRDNFRIWPYGERDDDWLELNQRRVNNPTLRVSNNQVIGFVEITHTHNPDLRDRTSREGLLDNPAFFDLKVLVLAALSTLETERFERRRALLAPKSSASAPTGDPILQLLRRVSEGNPGHNGGNGNGALKEAEQLYRQKAKKEQQRYQQVARLAGVGMAAELLTDAFSREISQAMIILHALEGEARAGASDEIRKLTERLNQRMEVVNLQLDLMGPLYRPSIQEGEPVNVRGAVYDAISLLSYRLAEIGTHIDLTGSTTLAVHMHRGHLMQVLMILLENSLNAMETAHTPTPLIEIQIDEDTKGFRVLDSGPGVPDHIRHLIFEPYYSTRHAGRGLGLSVARDILGMYSTSLNLMKGDFALPGACFEVRFDRRRIVKNTAVRL